MLLSDVDIRYHMHAHGLIIEPLEDTQRQPASIDLRLGTHLQQPGDATKPFPIPENGHMLIPGEFILGDTMERVEIPSHLAAQFGGKSSLGRQGIQVHCTAGFIDPGFRGTITVELFNQSNRGYWLKPGQTIGQLCVFQLSSPVERPYGHPDLKSKYMGQAGPTISRTD